MAPGRDATGFNKIIAADREKKKKQELADKIFGRRSSAPAAGAIAGAKRQPGPSSLASRVTKPSKLARPVRPANGLAARATGAGSLQRSVSTPQLNTLNARRNNALDIAVNGRSVSSHNIHNQVSIRNGTSATNGHGFSIKGASAPREYMVLAQNFAPGTSAEDVGSVFCPDPVEMGLISCRLIVERPTVIAELIFDNQDGAEQVVKKFNNKTADDRLLHVYHSDAPPSRPSNARQLKLNTMARAHQHEDDDMMEVEEERPRYQRSYQTPLGSARAQPDIQDGRYGFGDDNYKPRDRGMNGGGSDGGIRLVSDGMVGRSMRGNMNGGGSFSRRR